MARPRSHLELLRSARALTLDLYEQAWLAPREERPIDAPQQFDMSAVCAYATSVAVDVTTRAFRYSGGSALYKTNVLQRLLRDVNAEPST